MKFLIVFTAFLAFAAAASLPSQQKSNIQNDIIPYNEDNDNKNDVDIQEQESYNTIANSFDTIVRVISEYRKNLTKKNEFVDIDDEITIPDIDNVGTNSDTLLTNIHVRGLKNFLSQNITMSYKEDLVNAENSWEKLTINGLYHYVNSAANSNGVFEIVLIKPQYSGNTSLTKNANIYPTMSPASFVTFKKAVINLTKLPEVFQNEKPQFDNFIKNVVCQYVATAVSSSMYNDITMRIRQTMKPYLKYRSSAIANDDSVHPVGSVSGVQLELKNIRFDNAKNNLAKTHTVQMNNDQKETTANLQLRLLGLVGECDWSDNEKTQSGKVAFKFDHVAVVSAVNAKDKTAVTKVYVKSPAIDVERSTGLAEIKGWTEIKEKMTAALVEYFAEKLAAATNESIENAML